MDEHQQLLTRGTRLVPTGFPIGIEVNPRALFVTTEKSLTIQFSAWPLLASE
jgi:hypothetical protein